MTTTLTVLGGSAASVGTGQGCSGYLLATGTTNLVLDLGPGTLQELRKHADFRALDGIVISHLHVDHMLDLIAMRFSLAYNPVKPERLTPLWLPPGGIDMLDRLGEIFSGGEEPDQFFRGVFDLTEYDPASSVEIGDCTLTFTPTVHYVPCWAIRVSPQAQGALCYTADTGPSTDIAAFARGSEVLLAEATTPKAGETSEPAETRGHLTAQEAAAFAREARVRTLILTHCYEELQPVKVAEGIAGTVPFTVELATPGKRIQWS
jgi:ribonuclease BN (tRNA processing enzyme)